MKVNDEKVSLNARTASLLVASALAVVAGSWVAAWSTANLWHSGAGVGLPLLAGLLVLGAVWGRLYLVPYGAALATSSEQA
jgi:hypothetical protein